MGAAYERMRGSSSLAVIGVIGGVGAGKSRVLEILKERFGAQVILTDEVAHELMEPGQEGYRKVIDTFGYSVLGNDQTLDRRTLAELLFGDQAARKAMNDIIHPLVWESVKHKAGESKSGLIVVETALPEKKLGDICDELWYVYTLRENRIHRLTKARGYTIEKSENIMKSQLSDLEFREMSDHVIDNNGSFEETLKQLEDLLKTKER